MNTNEKWFQDFCLFLNVRIVPILTQRRYSNIRYGTTFSCGCPSTTTITTDTDTTDTDTDTDMTDMIMRNLRADMMTYSAATWLLLLLSYHCGSCRLGSWWCEGRRNDSVRLYVMLEKWVAACLPSFWGTVAAGRPHRDLLMKIAVWEVRCLMRRDETTTSIVYTAKALGAIVVARQKERVRVCVCVCVCVCVSAYVEPFSSPVPRLQ